MERRDAKSSDVIPRLRQVTLEGKDRLVTLSLVPGNNVYGERILNIQMAEYRVWDPYRSKLAAAFYNGLKDIPIKEGSRLLYLGASTGTTVSHISDILGPDGVLFAVEVAPRVAREFVERVAMHRPNIIPIISDARRPDKYLWVFSKVNTVYCDIAQPDQTEISLLNCRKYLLKGGNLFLIVKARSIDTLRNPEKIFKEEVCKLIASGFKIKEVIKLYPFDRDHALIRAVI